MRREIDHGHKVTKQRIEMQRIKLGLAADQIFGPESLYLSPQVHGVPASDGSRWSNYNAQVDREDYLKWQRKNTRKAA